MVNLNRQIGVTQARQGGFSSHVLPSPVGYQQLVPSWLFRPRQADGNWVVDFSPGGELQFAGGEQTLGFWIPTWTLETAAAPYLSAPWLASTVAGTRGVGQFSDGRRFLSQLDTRFAPANDASFTMEWWAKTSAAGNNTVSFITAAIRLNGAVQDPFRMSLSSQDGGPHVFSANFFLPGGTFSVGNDTLSSAGIAQWAHYAVVVDSQTGEVRLYINGQRVAADNNQGFAGINEYNWAGINEVRIQHRMETGLGAFSASAGASGLRFTSQVLYTSNFTPPQL